MSMEAQSESKQMSLPSVIAQMLKLQLRWTSVSLSQESIGSLNLPALSSHPKQGPQVLKEPGLVQEFLSRIGALKP